MKKILLFTFLFLIQSSFAQFITTWKTDNTGTSNDNQITIPTEGSGYDYIVDWGDGIIDSAVVGDITHTYSSIDTFTVSITGDFPRIYFNDSGDEQKILSVEQWGTNSWQSMAYAFMGASNLVINATDNPNLSSVSDMSWMFYDAISFNQDIGDWDVSNVTNMFRMFYGAISFNQDIGDWDVSNVINMSGLFKDATSFNQDIGDWDVSNVTNMLAMLAFTTSFNQDIGDWNVSNVTNMFGLFSSATSFNQDIGDWDVSNVTTTKSMFNDATSFNQDIGDWDVDSVRNMVAMFHHAISFNQDIGDWDVSNVTDMQMLFDLATSFNQDIGDWNVDSVRNMAKMFYYATSFNKDIGNWDVSNVIRMDQMFFNASSFNQNIGSWNTGDVTNMYNMFHNASSFNQDISEWDVSNVTDMEYMFLGAKLSSANYDSLLVGWNSQLLQSNVNFNAGYSKYCSQDAINARNNMINSYNWSISDGGQDCSENLFITTWKTDNPGISNNNQITIPTTGSGYDYIVDWGDGSTDSAVVGDITHTYSTMGTFTVSITGDFPRIYFNFIGDKEKILSVEQWGGNVWTSMENAFSGTLNLVINATDAPDLSNVINMSNMFHGDTLFNQDISDWDVSNVNNMSGMFGAAISFNQDIGNWDVGNVTTMNNMFVDVTLSSSNYDSLLIGWNNQILQNGIEFHGGESQFCSQEAIDARDELINFYNWTIYDAGHDTTCIPVGIEEDNIMTFTISPNPASNLLEVQLSKMVDGTFTFVDISGRILEKRNLENGKNNYTIDLSEYTPGLYFVEIQSNGNKFKSEKLIIQ